MLSGVGGATIAEAQKNMSMQEFQAWCEYRRKYGALDVRRTIEMAAATVAYIVAAGHFRKPGTPAPRFEHFLPQRKSEEKPLSLEQAMALWR